MMGIMRCLLKNYKITKSKSEIKLIFSLLSQHKGFRLRSTFPQLFSNTNIENLNKDRELEEKILFNSVIKHGRNGTENQLLGEKYNLQLQSTEPPVLALKYFYSDLNKTLTSNGNLISDTDETDNINFPYEKYHHITCNTSSDKPNSSEHERQEDDTGHNIDSPFGMAMDKPCKRPKQKWMKDYDKYVEIPVKHQKNDEEDNLNIDVSINYGTADASVPPSKVPCGGCGAFLHCQDSAIPGYLPKEIFAGLIDEQLQALVCQRCHFLREYDTALSVSVNPDLYPQLISKIKSQIALVVLVVDMTDFPCSIWPGIIDILGPKRPLIVVGNKIDLLQDQSKTWLQDAKEALIKQLPPKANLVHVTLVSAKTGYGVEDLITALYKIWEYRGDVYLVGCTNVGKSTLFNALLQSDYCKTKAVDLLQRATTAPWPGTTLNLLKFPIMRPEGWRLAMRSYRLKEQNIKPLQKIQEGKEVLSHQMISRITRTFTQGNTDKYSDDYWDDPFALPKLSTLRKLKSQGSGLDPSDPVFANSRWLYDTPGVITPDQIIDLLTTEELMLALPREPIIPRTFQLWSGQSLMVGGLGRLDYVSGPANIKLTVLAAFSMPVTLCWLSDADAVYQHYLGSEALAVPCGSSERLRRWPGLQAGPQFVLKGMGWKHSCADVVLSSVGWVAVTALQDSICHLQAWTPKARGIHVRVPPVLPRAIALKGCKMYRTQAYALFNKYSKDRR